MKCQVLILKVELLKISMFNCLYFVVNILLYGYIDIYMDKVNGRFFMRGFLRFF